MPLGELFPVLLGHANRGRRHQPALVNQGTGFASALTLLDEETLQVSGDCSLGEAGPLNDHDVGVEGCAADGHLPTGHQLRQISVYSSHFDLLSLNLFAKSKKGRPLSSALSLFAWKP